MNQPNPQDENWVLVPNKKPQKKKKKEKNWVLIFFLSTLLILIWEWLWPDVIPYTLFEFWKFDTLWAGVVAGLPIYLYGVFLQTIISLVVKKPLSAERPKLVVVLAGIVIISVFAGVFEEILFRWILFYSFFISLLIGDYLLGGFYFEHGLFWLLHVYVFSPIIEFISFGYLAWLFPKDWTIVFAVFGANACFRNEHSYQGLIGFLNSWVIGFFFFWIFFEFGLPAAITVHFFYNLVVLLTATFLAVGRGEFDEV